MPTPRKTCRRSCHWLEQFGAIHQHQGGHSPARNHRSGHDRLAEGRRRAQHAYVVMQHGRDGRLLVEAQGAGEGHVDRLTDEAFVTQLARNAVFAQKGSCGIEAAPWQSNVQRIVLGIANDARLVPH
ncbi:MAG TPA: hypothetical protein VLT37_06055 [Acidocella sp.]|nr:hypothetical protein [Acidocella sp.]